MSVHVDVEEEFPEEIIKQYFTDKYLTIWHMGFNNTNGYGYIFPKKNVINIGYSSNSNKRSQFQENNVKLY